MTFPSGVVAIRPGQSSVKVMIIPLDPAQVTSASVGLRFDGNAYGVEAYYAPSASEVMLAGPVTVVLRYPRHATIMLRSSDSGWTALSTTRYLGSLQVLANSDQLGVFVAAAPYGALIITWVPYLAAMIGLAAAVTVFLLIRRRSFRPGA